MASRIAARYVSRRMSSGGRVLGEEERAAENIYIKKMEKEKLEKLARKGPENATPSAPISEATTAASTPSAAASSTSKASTDKYRNYGVIAGVVAGLGGLGWYLMASSKKPEAQEQD
ncbi:hypothetical protein MKW98_005400 [Papaver atlanticum]|uniref:F1F0-ATPase inhibitor protein n=1 Tax=Papaver atlanticum TaxID=357466 RepID=A0AAD4X4V6_9MAGN|nr:hypothetical protein MKW98_005400 [Papaver atlanticum]